MPTILTHNDDYFCLYTIRLHQIYKMINPIALIVCRNKAFTFFPLFFIQINLSFISYTKRDPLIKHRELNRMQKAFYKIVLCLCIRLKCNKQTLFWKLMESKGLTPPYTNIYYSIVVWYTPLETIRFLFLVSHFICKNILSRQNNMRFGIIFFWCVILDGQGRNQNEMFFFFFGRA